MSKEHLDWSDATLLQVFGDEAIKGDSDTETARAVNARLKKTSLTRLRVANALRRPNVIDALRARFGSPRVDAMLRVRADRHP